MHSVPLMMDVFSNNKNAYHERKMRNNNKSKQWCLIIYIYILKLYLPSVLNTIILALITT